MYSQLRRVYGQFTAVFETDIHALAIRSQLTVHGAFGKADDRHQQSSHNPPSSRTIPSSLSFRQLAREHCLGRFGLQPGIEDQDAHDQQDEGSIKNPFRPT